MIDLYHCMSARSFRPLWLLEELQLPYQLHMLPFPPRALARGYLQENPLGTVPLLVAGDVRMTESAAICQYLAATHPEAGLDVAPGDAAYGAYLNWLHMGEATLTFPQTLLLRYGRFESPDRLQPQVVTDYTRWFLARLRAVEAATEGESWLCAGRFTAADVSVGYALLLATHLGLGDRWSDATRAYWQRLQDRPGYQRAMVAQRAAAEAQGVSSVPSPDTQP